MHFSPPGSSVHGISQTSILEWVAISFSRGSSWPRAWAHLLLGRWIFYHWTTREAHWQDTASQTSLCMQITLGSCSITDSSSVGLQQRMRLCPQTSLRTQITLGSRSITDSGPVGLGNAWDCVPEPHPKQHGCKRLTLKGAYKHCKN